MTRKTKRLSAAHTLKLPPIFSMLLVILGAGASYDCIPHRDDEQHHLRHYRFPLANQLFAPRPPFQEILKTVPQARDLVPRLAQLHNGTSVEQLLATMKAEEAEYTYRKTQLTPIKFYIRDELNRQCFGSLFVSAGPDCSQSVRHSATGQV